MQLALQNSYVLLLMTDDDLKVLDILFGSKEQGVAVLHLTVGLR